MPFLNQIGKFEDLRCGLIHIFNNLPVPVPLKKVRLNVKIVDFVAEISIIVCFPCATLVNSRDIIAVFLRDLLRAE